MENTIELINNRKFIEARQSLASKNVVNIAAMLEDVDKESMVKIFRVLPKDMAADVFTYLSPEQRLQIIKSITDKEIASIIDELFMDDTVDFLEELPSNVVKKVLKNTDEDTRKIINQFLNYPENSAGSIMTIEYADLKKHMTVAEAIAHIKKTGIDKETINTCYVLGDNRELLGIVSLRKLILSEPDVKIENLMKKDFIYVNTLDDQEYVANIAKKYDLVTIPVTDNEKKLVGIITIDDIVDIIDQETTEDFQKMAAMAPNETPYLKTSVWDLAKHRILWLLVLMISATFTGAIIQKFENALSAVVLLASFIPMLMDTGGNAGSQSSTLVIRGLALGEIKLSDWYKVIFKEFRVSIIAGFVLAAVNFLRLIFIEHTGVPIALTVCISLFITIIIAKIVGGLLPIAAKRLNLDPAIMASPLITTIVDAMALTVFFTLAVNILNIPA